MYSVKVEDHDRYRLSETDQTTPSYFALLEEVKEDAEFDFVTTTPLFRCRDYFNDVLYAQHHNESVQDIYGFQAYYTTSLAKELKKGFVNLLLHFPKGTYTNWKALHLVEDYLGFWRTRVLTTKTSGDVLHNTSKILVVDARWFTNPLMLSFYTQCVRLLYYNADTYYQISQDSVAGEGSDANFLPLFANNPKMLFFLDNWEKILGTNTGHILSPEDVDEDPELDERHIDYIHDGGGILSFWNGINSDCREGRYYEPAVRAWVVRFNKLWDNREEIIDD